MSSDANLFPAAIPSYCGSVLSNGASLSKTSSNAGMPCSGEPSSVCGGPSALTLIYNSNKLNADLSPKAGTGASSASASASSSAPASAATLPAGFKSASSSLIAEGTNGRALISASTSSNSMTPAVCASYCSGLGYPLSGTEYSSEWCVPPRSTPSLCFQLLTSSLAHDQLLRVGPFQRRVARQDVVQRWHALLG